MRVLLYLARYPTHPGYWSRWDVETGTGLPEVIFIRQYEADHLRNRVPKKGLLFADLEPAGKHLRKKKVKKHEK